MLNILLTCSGRKIHLINSFLETIKDNSKLKIFLCDNNPNVISKSFGNYFWESPKFIKKNYKEILFFLKKKKIKIIFPTSDKELLFWSNYKNELLKNDIKVMVSSKDTIQICQDKIRFYNFLCNNNIETIYTSNKLNLIKSKKYVVKNQFSNQEKKNYVNISYQASKNYSKRFKNPIFQPFISGTEVSIDCFVDKKKNTQILLRERCLVNQGESEKTKFFRNKKISKQIINIVNKLEFFGHIMFQGIKKKNKFYILECNPRIGGASSTCFYKGLNSFKNFIEENSKIKLQFTKNLTKKNCFIIHKKITAID